MIFVLAATSCSDRYIEINCCPVNTCQRGNTVLDLENAFDCQQAVIRACQCGVKHPGKLEP